MPRTWTQTSCALCNSTDGTSLLSIPHPDAPGGLSHLWQCRGCGLRRLNPRPDDASIGAYYGDAAASAYNAYGGRRRSHRKQVVWDFLRDGYSRPSHLSPAGRLLAPVTRPLARWLFDINVELQRSRRLRVLEVGSGFGDILIYLQSRGCEVLGTDLSPDAARQGAAHGVAIRHGTLSSLGIPDHSFDIGILCHSLEHVPDPNVELRDLSRILRPSGLLHIAVPNGNAVRLRTDGLRWAHLSHPLHFWYFDPGSLVRLLQHHGFELVGIPTTTTRHHAWTEWLHNVRRDGLLPASRRLLRFLHGIATTRDGGDVLRVTARRPAADTPTPAPAAP